jgi:parvulin-like peptidyl-prolyl isomerase
VATVNGEPIRASELIQVSYDWFAATAIEELIVHRVIEQEARAQGVSVSVEEVEARYKQRLQSAEAQLPPGMSLDDFLKRNQVPPSRLFAQTRTLLLAEKLLERQVNLDDFVEYSQLVIRIQGNTPEQQEENTPAAEAKAQEAYQKIKEGLDFAEAVKEYSEDPFSKDRGGKMNWQDMKFIVPDLRQKLLAMQPGEISEPFKMMGSYYDYPQGAHGVASLARRAAGAARASGAPAAGRVCAPVASEGEDYEHHRQALRPDDCCPI